MNKKMSEKIKILRESQDAQVWAEWFMATKETYGWKLKDIDEGLMLCWFANCMTAIRDFGPERKRITKLEGLLREAELILRVDPSISDMTKYLDATLNKADEIHKALEGE